MSHIMHVVLNDGRKLTITGFANTEEMVLFSSAVDSDVFDFNNITFEPVEAQELPNDLGELSLNDWAKLIG
jgi:hypothetical protein